MSSDSDSDFGDCDFIGATCSSIQNSWSDAKLHKITEVHPSDDVENSSLPTKVRKVTQTVGNTAEKKRIEDEEDSDEKKREDVSLEVENITPPPSPAPDFDNSLNGRGRGGGRGRGKTVRGAKRTRKTEKALKNLENMEKRTEKEMRENEIVKFLERKSRESEILEIQDEEEIKFLLKVKFKTDIHRIEINKSERLGAILDRFASSQNLKAGAIYFEDYNRDQTVASLNLNVASILHARIRSDSDFNRKEDFIEIKVQSNNRRDVISIKIRKFDKMSVLMEQYSKMKNTSKDDIRFLFDGEELDPDETCETLDLEGGEILDAHFNS